MENWDDLRVFLAVARAGGLSAAARRLRLDPATLGRRIGRLEDRMGGALFVKSPQGYALTDLGARMLDNTARAEEALAQALEEGQGRSSGLSGLIRIGAPDGCANYLLPQICATLQARNPGLEVQILALPRVVNLSKREADMAITVSPPDAGRLTVQKITGYHLHLAARADIAAQVRGLGDVLALPIVGYIPDMIFDKELDYLGEIGAASVHLASNSVAVQIMAMRAGAGIGIMHDFAMPLSPELRFVLRDRVSLRRAFYLVRHASDRRSERLNRFAAALVSEMQSEVERLEQLARLTGAGRKGDAGGDNSSKEAGHARATDPEIQAQR